MSKKDIDYVTDVRAFSPTPMNLALLSRLSASQLYMDTTTALTKGVHPLESALLTVVPLADLGFPTLILRENEHGYIGQMRHRYGDLHAHLALLAPIPEADKDLMPWVRLVSGLIEASVERGALTMVAELPEEEAAAVQLLRQLGFVIYARQSIYRYQKTSLTLAKSLSGRVRLRRVQLEDEAHLRLLYAKLVPSLIQQAYPASRPSVRANDHSLVVETTEDNRIVGHFNIAEGRSGLLVTPLLHPDIYDDVGTLVLEALQHWPKHERLPLYVSIRSYQEWLATPLADAGMQLMDRQLLFVKQMAKRVKTNFESVLNRAENNLGKWVGNWDVNLQQD